MLRKSVRIFFRIKRPQEMGEATIEANPTDPTVLREHLTQSDGCAVCLFEHDSAYGTAMGQALEQS
jgi:hypothetical protein